MKYQILSSGNIPALENKVNEYLNRGWKLTGGVSSCLSGKYYQAMYITPIPSFNITSFWLRWRYRNYY